MIRNLIAVFTALAALGMAAAVHAAGSLDRERPRLKPQAVVTSGVVRVGDLVAHAGIIADVPIFRAPDLGTTGTVSAEAVVEAVRAHALIGLDTGGIDRVEVTRASRTIAPQVIEDCLTRALAKKYSLGEPADIALEIDGGLAPQYVEPSALGKPQVARLDYDSHDGRFYALVALPKGAAGHAALRLAGRATVTEKVAIVARAIERGTILKSADLMMERRPTDTVGHDVVTERRQAVGLAARTELQPGRPLHTAELMKPELIRRNDQVTLIYRVPGITLTIRGKAIEGGAEGDVITVLNEQSKRTLQGTVVGRAHVVVNTRMPQLAGDFALARSGSAGAVH